MKRIFSLVFALLLVPQLAFASGAHSLKQAIDEYAYSLTVEWDQHDIEFAKAQSEVLEEAFKALLKDGLSKDEINDVLKSYSPRLDWDEIRLELSLMDLSDALAIENMVRSKVDYASGASWNGRHSVGIVVVFAVVLIGALSVGIGGGHNDYNN